MDRLPRGEAGTSRREEKDYGLLANSPNPGSYSYDILYHMAISASEARQRLFPLIEEVNTDQEPIEIVSKKGTAFLVSAEHYNSLVETIHILSNPANTSHVLNSLAQAHRGELLFPELLGE